MDRFRVWLAVAPLIAAGVLAGHGLAYRLTGTPSGSLHAYLEHAPQILLLLAVVAPALAGLEARLRSPSIWAFPAAAFTVFAVQEHLERLVHTGELPWLVTSPAFVVGLVFQLPVALAVWAVVRRLLGACEELRMRPARLPRLLVRFAAPPAGELGPAVVRLLSGRGPPLLPSP